MEITINKPARLQLSDNTKEWIKFWIRALCVFLFLFSAFDKFFDHARFLHGLAPVKVIGPFASFISWAVPCSETLVAVLVYLRRTFVWGLYGFTGLMAVFTAYITIMVLWAEKLPCRCNILIEQLTLYSTSGSMSRLLSFP